MLLKLKPNMMSSQNGLHSERKHSTTTGTAILNLGKINGMIINALPPKKLPRLPWKKFKMPLRLF
jgi:hypothetical protein